MVRLLGDEGDKVGCWMNEGCDGARMLRVDEMRD